MNLKLAIAILFFILSGLIAADLSRAEFTVDGRSSLHFGVSAALSGTCNLMTKNAQSPVVRRAMCFGGAMVIGTVKEFGLDAHPDYGDIFFNGLGAAAGIALTDRVILHLSRDAVNVTVTY